MRLDFELHWYIVTDRSLRIRTGVLRLQEATMSFANLQPVTVTQGPLQRLLGLADVRVQSAGGGGNDEHKPGTDTSLHTGVFHGVANATEIRALILHRLRQFRATGLGDPDDHLSLVGGVPPTRANSSPALAAAIDTLAAAREVLHEAAALRREISAGTPLQRLSFPVTVSTSTRSPASPSMPNTENDASTLDQATLLTTAQLRLSSDVRVSDARSQRAVVKYQPGRNYLVVSPPQFKVLTDFTTARAVPGVLLDLISKRRCPPLREFYELIVKAFHAGILQVADQPLPPTVSPSPWKAQTNGGPARWLAILAMAAATTTLFVRNLELPNETWELLTGWLLSCVAMSLGYAAAACVLKGAGGEIYHPKFHWLTLAPHFRVDLEDVIMTGQKTEIDVALVRMAPQFILAALAALYAPALLLPLLCGVFVVISPFWRSPMLDLLRALYRDPRLSTSYDFMFAQNRLFSVLLRSRIKFADRTFLLVCSSYTLVWLFLLFSAGTSLLNVNAPELFQRFKAAGGLHFTALTLLTLFGAMATCALGVVSW
ncbi:MAG: PH domain-containing protein, partial [Undibacterium sp.]|nr:PH domain-containing protein [Opitutaceae bacterium]